MASFCSRVGFELEVLTPSQADALAKLLIEKGLFTREESMRKVSEERATYQNSSIPRSNDHRRHFDLGNHQRLLLIPVVHTVDPEGGSLFHRTGSAFPLRSSVREGFSARVRFRFATPLWFGMLFIGLETGDYLLTYGLLLHVSGVPPKNTRTTARSAVSRTTCENRFAGAHSRCLG